MPAYILSSAGIESPYFSFIGRAGHKLEGTGPLRERPVFRGIRTAAVLNLDGEFEEALE